MQYQTMEVKKNHRRRKNASQNVQLLATLVMLLLRGRQERRSIARSCWNTNTWSTSPIMLSMTRRRAILFLVVAFLSLQAKMAQASSFFERFERDEGSSKMRPNNSRSTTGNPFAGEREDSMRSSRLPIDYPFPAAKLLDDDEEKRTPSSLSPRRDIISKYTAHSFRRKMLLFLSSTLGLGMIMGTVIGQSLHLKSSRSLQMMLTFCFACFYFFKSTIYSEWTKSCGMLLLLVLPAYFKRIRPAYPTYILSRLLTPGSERRPFPSGVENPWRYQPRESSVPSQEEEPDYTLVLPEFSMIPTLASATVMGIMIGASLPLVPTSMGAICGGISLAYGCTLRSSYGDLCRVMGMRVVALVWAVRYYQDQVKFVPKTQKLVQHIVDKALFLDRQHSIRHRIGSILSWLYHRGTRVVQKVQTDMKAEDEPDYRSSSGDIRDKRRPPDPDRRFRNRDRPPPRRYRDDRDPRERRRGEAYGPGPRDDHRRSSYSEWGEMKEDEGGAGVVPPPPPPPRR